MENKPTLFAAVAVVFAVMAGVGYLLTTELAGRLFSIGPNFNDPSLAEDSVKFRDGKAALEQERKNDETSAVEKEVTPRERREKTELQPEPIEIEVAEKPAEKPSTDVIAVSASPPALAEIEDSEPELLPTDLDPNHAIKDAKPTEALIAGGINPTSLQSISPPATDDQNADNTGNQSGEEEVATLPPADPAPTEEADQSPAESGIETPTVAAANAQVDLPEQAAVDAKISPPIPESGATVPAASILPEPTRQTSPPVSIDKGRVVVGGRGVGLDYSNALAGSVSGMIGGLEAPSAQSDRIQYSPSAGFSANGTGNTVMTIPNVQADVTGAAANSTANAAASVRTNIPSVTVPSVNAANPVRVNVPNNVQGAVRNVVPNVEGANVPLPVNVPVGIDVNAAGLNIRVNVP